MTENNIIFKAIGRIESPHTIQTKTPVQPAYAEGIKGKIVVFEEYKDGLQDLEEFSHIFIFYHFNEAIKTELKFKPYLQNEVHGVFATRAPFRPNKLGMSLVRLDKIEGNIIHILDIDVLNDTPLIDIKPYVHGFDYRENVKSGWQDTVTETDAKIRGKRNYKE